MAVRPLGRESPGFLSKSLQFSKADLTDSNLIGKLVIEHKYIYATTRRINIKISKIRPGKVSELTSEK